MAVKINDEMRRLLIKFNEIFDETVYLIKISNIHPIFM